MPDPAQAPCSSTVVRSASSWRSRPGCGSGGSGGPCAGSDLDPNSSRSPPLRTPARPPAIAPGGRGRPRHREASHNWSRMAGSRALRASGRSRVMTSSSPFALDHHGAGASPGSAGCGRSSLAPGGELGAGLERGVHRRLGGQAGATERPSLSRSSRASEVAAIGRGAPARPPRPDRRPAPPRRRPTPPPEAPPRRRRATTTTGMAASAAPRPRRLGGRDRRSSAVRPPGARPRGRRGRCAAPATPSRSRSSVHSRRRTEMGVTLACARSHQQACDRPPTPASAWAPSGAMALTGWPDASRTRAASRPGRARLDAVAQRLAQLTARAGHEVVIDPIALLTERAALAGFTRAGTISCGGGTRLLAGADGLVGAVVGPSQRRGPGPGLARAGGGRPGRAGPAPADEDLWAEVARRVTARSRAELEARAALLGLPVGILPADDVRTRGPDRFAGLPGRGRCPRRGAGPHRSTGCWWSTCPRCGRARCAVGSWPTPAPRGQGGVASPTRRCARRARPSSST